MVIYTHQTREQRIAKAREMARRAANSAFFTDPKYQDPRDTTIFCGPIVENNKGSLCKQGKTLNIK